MLSPPCSRIRSLQDRRISVTVHFHGPNTAPQVAQACWAMRDFIKSPPLERFPTKATEPSLFCYLTHSWGRRDKFIPLCISECKEPGWNLNLAL